MAFARSSWLFQAASVPALLLAKVPPLLDVLAPEHLLGCQLIVRATTDAKILGIVSAAERPRFGRIELQERPRLATSPLRRNVGALQTVPFVNLASRCARNSTRFRRLGASSTARTRRAFQSRQAFTLELLDEQIDRPVHDDREIAARVRVTQEIAAEFELFAKLGARGELHLEASDSGSTRAGVILEGTSGFGKRAATTAWTSPLLIPETASKSSR